MAETPDNRGTERVYAAADPARTAGGGVTLNRRHAYLSAPEDEEDRREDADRGRQVVPRDGLAHHQHRERHEDEERDRLLRDLQLLQRHRLRADPVGGDGHAVFDERDQPRDEDRHPGRRARQAAQVAVPGVEHYEVRHAEKPHGHPIDV